MTTRTRDDEYRKIAKEILDDIKYRNIAAAVVGAGTDDEEEEDDDESEMKDEEEKDEADDDEDEDEKEEKAAIARVATMEEEDDDPEKIYIEVLDKEWGKKKKDIAKTKQKQKELTEEQKEKLYTFADENEEPILLHILDLIKEIDTTTKIDDLIDLKKKLWEAQLEVDKIKLAYRASGNSDDAHQISRFISHRVSPAIEKIRNYINAKIKHPEFVRDDVFKLVSADEIFEEMLNNPEHIMYQDRAALLEQLKEVSVDPLWREGGMNEGTINEISEAINQQLQQNPLPNGVQRGFYSWGDEIPKDVWENDEPKRIVLIVPMKVSNFHGIATAKETANTGNHTLTIIISQENEGPNAPSMVTIADPSHNLNALITEEEDGHLYVGLRSDPTKPKTEEERKKELIPLNKYIKDRVLRSTNGAANASNRRTNWGNLKAYLKKHKPNGIDVKYPPMFNWSGDCASFALTTGWYLITKDDLQRDFNKFLAKWAGDYRPVYWKNQTKDAVKGNTVLSDIEPVLKLFTGMVKNMKVAAEEGKEPGLISKSYVKELMKKPVVRHSARLAAKQQTRKQTLLPANVSENKNKGQKRPREAQAREEEAQEPAQSRKKAKKDKKDKKNK